MKTYGLSRQLEAEFCDTDGLITYTRKSSLRRRRKKGDDYKNTVRNPDKKRSSRHVYKKKYRQDAKKEILEAMDD